MTVAAAAPPAPIRRELASDRHAYELVLQSLGVTLRVEEAEHDAAVFLTPPQIVELRADLAHALLVLNPTAPPVPGIRSEAGRRVLEDLRKVFVALVEHDKLSANEVDELTRAVIAHCRAWRPYVLREVTP